MVNIPTKIRYFWDCIPHTNLVALSIIYYVMNLLMYIGNDLIESIPVEEERVRIPGYLGQFKRTLKIKYQELISKYATPPEFLVSDIRADIPANLQQKGKAS
jgi:hypothetical protein